MVARRPRLPRGVALTVALAAAAAFTVGLAQRPVQSSFTGSTGDSGNQVTAATDFCSSPGSSTLTADGDSYVDQGSPTSVSGGSATYLVVTPQAASAHRVFVRFPTPLPTIPSGCTMTATLRIYAQSPIAGRTLGAYRADPTVAAWTEGALNWNNQPAHLGPAATVLMPSANGYVDWTVTGLVQSMYSAGSNGFVVRDQDETGPGAWQQFNSRAVATNKPVLVIAWN